MGEIPAHLKLFTNHNEIQFNEVNVFKGKKHKMNRK